MGRDTNVQREQTCRKQEAVLPYNMILPCTLERSHSEPGAGGKLTALQEMVPVPRRSPGRRLQPPTVWWATIWGSVQYLAHTLHHSKILLHPSPPDVTRMCCSHHKNTG